MAPLDANIAADPFGTALHEAARTLEVELRARNWRLACAESCTGGLAAAAITGLAGSSDWFDRGFVTYSNRAKSDMLGVPTAMLETHGAVSREVAAAMARGVLMHAPVQAALSITGIAGPGGGSPDKPVGLVWFGWAWIDGTTQAHVHTESVVWPGDRHAVRLASARHALLGLARRIVTA